MALQCCQKDWTGRMAEEYAERDSADFKDTTPMSLNCRMGWHVFLYIPMMAGSAQKRFSQDT
jgi:hypothetical protein